MKLKIISIFHCTVPICRQIYTTGNGYVLFFSADRNKLSSVENNLSAFELSTT